MSLYFLLLLISNFYSVLCIKPAPGQPVPNSEILDEILTAHINTSYYNSDSIVDFILGNATTDINAENLAVNILDVDNVKKIIGQARRQYKYTQETHETFMLPNFRDRMAYDNNSFIVNKSLDMMIQSIYQTRYRIRRTKDIRDAYSEDISFKVAVLYGAANAIIIKMDNVYTQLKNLPYKSHFLWFLVLYEKLLAHNVDVSNSIERIFLYHEAFVKKYFDNLPPDENDKSKEADIEKAKSMWGGK